MFYEFQPPLDVTNHSVAREVVTFFTLPPGDYIVVPQTNVPNCDGKFLLRILTDEQSNIWSVQNFKLILFSSSFVFLFLYTGLFVLIQLSFCLNTLSTCFHTFDYLFQYNCIIFFIALLILLVLNALLACLILKIKMKINF